MVSDMVVPPFLDGGYSVCGVLGISFWGWGVVSYLLLVTLFSRF